METDEKILLKMLDKMYTRSEEVTYYVDEVLPNRGRYCIFGMAGKGKSTVTLDIATHIASGIPWMGHQTHPGKILWINLNDEPATVLKTRLDQLMRGLGNTGNLSNLMIVNQSEWEKPIGLKNNDEKNNLYELIDAWKPEILIVDSLRKLLPYKDHVMNIKPLQILYDDYPNMVHFYIHHAQQKGITNAELFASDSPGSYMANSSDLVREVDGYFVINGTVRDNRLESISLRAISKRFLILPRSICIDVEQGDKTLILKYGGLYIPELRLEQKLIIDVLMSAGKESMSIEELVDSSESSLSRATVYRYVEELYDGGWIELVSRGKKGKRFYRLTEEGRKNAPAL